MKLRKSQRIMSLFLSLLMLLSTFAGSGFTVRAAEPTEVEAEDLDETSAAPTEVEGEELTPDASHQDVELILTLKSAVSSGHVGYAFTDGGDSVSAISFTSGTNTGVAAVGSNESAKKFSDAASDKVGLFQVDSTQADGFSFYLVADDGYDFKDKPIVELEYNDFHTYEHSQWNDGDAKLAANVKIAEQSASTFTVTPVADNPRLLLVNLSKTLLEAVEKGSYYSDYVANSVVEAKTKYRFNPQLKITADVAKGIKSKEFPMSSLVLSADIAGADMHADTIAVSKRTVEYNTTTGGSNADELITGLGTYVTGKTLTAAMVSVTYTPLTVDASESKETTVTASSSAVNVSADPAIYAQYDSNNLKVNNLWLNDYITGKANLTVSVDGSLADANFKNVTVNSNPYVKAVYKTGTTENLSGTKYDITKALDFDIVLPTAEGVATTKRTVKKVTVTETNDKTVLQASAGTASNPTYKYGVASGIDDDITIDIVTQEEVTAVTKAAGTPTVLGPDGEEITTATKIETGTENYTFQVVPTSGNVVKEVKISFEGDTSWTTLTATPAGSNFYTITGKIEKAVSFNVSEEAGETRAKVAITNVPDKSKNWSAQGTSTPATTALTKVSNVYSGIGTATEIKESDYEAANAATESKYYYFTVKTLAGYAAIAKYHYGQLTSGQTDITKYNKEPVLVKSTYAAGGNTFVYRTAETLPINTTEVDLYISTQKVVKIVAPENPIVKASFGDSIIVPADETYSFTLETVGAEGTATIENVVYTKDTVSSTTKPSAESNILGGDKDGTLDLVGGQYTVGSAILDGMTAGNELQLFVQTKDVITEGYTVKFDIAGDDKATYPVLSGAVGSQKLTLGYGDTSDALTAEFKKTDRTKTNITSTQTAGDEDKPTTTEGAEGLFPKSYDSDNTKTDKNIVTLADSSGTKVTGAKIGKDTITSTLVVKPKNSDSNWTGDQKIYSGSLDVEVAAQWSDLKLVADSSFTDSLKPAVKANATPGTSDDNEVVKFVVEGTNTKTKLRSAITDQTTGVTNAKFWFDPDNSDADSGTETYLMGTVIGTVNATSVTNASGNAIFVRAKNTDEPKITVKGEITLDGVKDPIPVERELTIIEDKGYAPFVSYTYAGGKEKVVGWIDGSSQITNPTNAIVNTDGVTATDDQPILELAAGGLNSLTVNYPLYKQLGNTHGAVSSTSDLETAVNAGTYDLASKTNTVEYKIAVENTPATDKTEYVTASVTNDGVATITAKEKNGAVSKVTISAFVDGVKVAENTIAVTVVNGIAKSSVQLLLDDEFAFTTDDAAKKGPATLTQQVLTGSYYTGKTNEIVEENNNVKQSDVLGGSDGTNTKSVRGIIFTKETPGQSFTLPKSTDFNTSKFGKGRILLGWQRIGTLSGATATGTAGAYFYEGEAVTISATAGDNIYQAIWADEYSFGTDAVASDTTKVGLGRVLYNANVGTASETDGPIDTYATKFSEVTDATTLAAASPVGKIAGGNTIKLAIKLSQRVPYSKEMKDKGTDVANATKFGNATTKPVYKTGADGLKLTAGGSENENGNSKMTVNNTEASISVASNAGAVSNSFNELNNVTASWTNNGIEFKTVAIPVNVVADQKFTIAWDENNATSMLVDQSSNNTLKVVLKKDGKTAISSGSASSEQVLLSNYTGYGFTYEATPEGVVDITAATDAESLTASHATADTITITPLKAGTATIKVTVRDAQGLEKSATTTLEVKDNGVTFTITEIGTNKTVAGTKADPLYALASNANTAKTSTNYVFSTSPAVTFGTVTGDDKQINASGNSFDGQNKLTLTSKATGNSSTAAQLGDGYITVQYTKNGDTTKTQFTKKLNVSTYFEIKLAKNTNIEIYEGDTKVVDDTNADDDGIVRVTTKNQENIGTAAAPNYIYTNIDLSGFSAKYTDTTDPKSFIGWKKANTALGSGEKYHYTTIIEDKLTSATTDGTNALQSGLYQLDPQFVSNPITKAITGQTTIRLSNEDAPYLASTSETINSKNIELNIEPYNTKDTIIIVPEKNKAKLYSGDGTKSKESQIGWETYNAHGTAKTLSGGKAELAFGSDITKGAHDGPVYVDGTERVDNFTIYAIKALADRRAGVLTFDIQSKASGQSLNTITVYINGYDSVDKGYYENGKLVVSDSRSVAGQTYFFDEKGVHVEGDAIITKADGTKIAIDNGALVPADTSVTLTGDYAGTYYVKADGTIAANEIVTVNGKERLFREDGTLVSFSDSDVVKEADGQTGKITVGGVPYVISQDGSAVMDDVRYNAKVTWKTNFPNSFTKGSTAPVLTYTITYTSKNSGKTGTTDEISVTAVSTDNYTASSTAASVTFTATADLNGYFVDKDAKTPAANDVKTKTYKFKDGGTASNPGVEIAEEAGISIVGLVDEYEYTGAAIQPDFIVMDDSRDEPLAKGVDYTVKFTNNKNANSVATITITGKGNYAGANATATFKIVDVYAELTTDDRAALADLKGAKIGAIAAASYTGEAIYPDITLTLKGGSPVTYIAANDYTASNGDSLYDVAVITISNNVNKGTATVLLQGRPNDKGKVTTVKKTFKINAVDLSTALTNEDDFSVEIAEEAEFRVKGATPAISISYKGKDLIAGQDYTVKSTGKSTAKAAAVTITGKGNFAKKFSQAFKVTPLSLSDCEFKGATVYAGVKGTAVKATILDPNGDALAVKKHFTLDVAGDGALDAKGKLVAEKDVTITATATGVEIEEGSTASIDAKVGANLAKAKVKVDNKTVFKTYTGEAIELTEEDFAKIPVTLTINKVATPLKYGEDYVVAGYTNNVKKGSMTVTIVGVGETLEHGTISGTKTFKVKINAKSIVK